MNVPFVDLKAQYHIIKNEIDMAIQNVIEETAFVRGKYVAAFEKEYAAAYGVKHCISVANGTDAIYITLKMLGIGAGDEVITVANSWISTSETISQTGARPVFIDIDQYYHIDASKIEEKITPSERRSVPVQNLRDRRDGVPVSAKVSADCFQYAPCLGGSHTSRPSNRYQQQ